MVGAEDEAVAVDQHEGRTGGVGGKRLAFGGGGVGHESLLLGERSIVD